MAKTICLPYTELPIQDTQGNIIGSIHRPLIQVRFSTHYGSLTPLTTGLIDSGADRNLFPIGIAQYLGVNLKKAKEKEIVGIGGKKIKAYAAKVNIFVNNIKFETEADFSPDQMDLLFGRQGFFDLFESIKFIEGNKTFEVTFK